MYLQELFIRYDPDRIYGTWKHVLKEKCNMSDSYARKLRALAVLLKDYPKFRQLSISFHEMNTLKPRVEKMLKVRALAEFWARR